jgi:hypothetical protein
MLSTTKRYNLNTGGRKSTKVYTTFGSPLLRNSEDLGRLRAYLYTQSRTENSPQLGRDPPNVANYSSGYSPLSFLAVHGLDDPF